MDPSIAWFQPEQFGPALDLWSSIWQTRQNPQKMDISSIMQTDNFENSMRNHLKKANSNGSDHDPKIRNFENIARTHGLNFNSHLIKKYGGTPWRNSDKKYSPGVIGLQEEIEDFFKYIKPSPEEHAMRQDVVNRLRTLINKEWPEAQVDVFGSFRTELYLPTGDIDLVIIGHWETLPLFSLEKALKESDIPIPDSIKVLDRASVPIVKLVDAKTYIKVDISFNMTNAVKSANLIKDFMARYPALPKLVMVLKQFLLQRDLNEVFKGGISSYSLILLTISFLQLYPRNYGSVQEVNLGILLIEFFELYGRNFNYYNTGISIKDGGSYYPRPFVTDPVLSIEDPLTQGNDIGKSSYGILNVRKAFEYAYIVLSQAAHGSHTYNCHNYSNYSYLGRIIRITDEIIEYRKWIRHKFPISGNNRFSSPKSSLVQSSHSNCSSISSKGGGDNDLSDAHSSPPNSSSSSIGSDTDSEDQRSIAHRSLQNESWWTANNNNNHRHHHHPTGSGSGPGAKPGMGGNAPHHPHGKPRKTHFGGYNRKKKNNHFGPPSLATSGGHFKDGVPQPAGNNINARKDAIRR